MQNGRLQRGHRMKTSARSAQSSQAHTLSHRHITPLLAHSGQIREDQQNSLLEQVRQPGISHSKQDSGLRG